MKTITAKISDIPAEHAITNLLRLVACGLLLDRTPVSEGWERHSSTMQAVAMEELISEREKVLVTISGEAIARVGKGIIGKIEGSAVINALVEVGSSFARLAMAGYWRDISW